MSLKDQIETLLRERGPMTVPDMLDIIFPNTPVYERRTKIALIFNKCSNLADWERIERTGKDERGQTVWRAIE